MYYRDSCNLQCSEVAFEGYVSLGFVLKKGYIHRTVRPINLESFLLKFFEKSSAIPKTLSQHIPVPARAPSPKILQWTRKCPFSFRKCPFFVRKKCPRSVVPPSLRCFLRPWLCYPPPPRDQSFPQNFSKIWNFLVAVYPVLRRRIAVLRFVLVLARVASVSWHALQVVEAVEFLQRQICKPRDHHIRPLILSTFFTFYAIKDLVVSLTTHSANVRWVRCHTTTLFLVSYARFSSTTLISFTKANNRPSV